VNSTMPDVLGIACMGMGRDGGINQEELDFF
jgi:hypothetical protein